MSAPLLTLPTDVRFPVVGILFFWMADLCCCPLPVTPLRDAFRPFFLDLRTLRRVVTNGRPGVPLYLQLRVEGGCKPGGYGCKRLPDALVDVWHTDSRGIYRYGGSPELGGGEGRKVEGRREEAGGGTDRGSSSVAPRPKCTTVNDHVLPQPPTGCPTTSYSHCHWPRTVAPPVDASPSAADRHT